MTDPATTVTRLPPVTKRDRTPRWAVRYGGEQIGYIEERTSGRRVSHPYWTAYIDIQGQTIPFESSGDFDERVAAIIAAWEDPASSVHVKYWLKL